jgi:hypothetical protein
MSSTGFQRILVGLSTLLIAAGVIAASGYWTAPKITIITSGPGQPVIFRIHFYLLDYDGTWNSWTLLGPSVENNKLWKIQLPGAEAPAIRVWDPDGVEYQWVGPPVPIVVQKPGVDEYHPGADENYYVDIVFDPANKNGWNRVPDTSKPGKYRVDFDGNVFLSTGGPQPFITELYFDILHGFYVPEMSSISIALVLSGLAMLVLRKRLVK